MLKPEKEYPFPHWHILPGEPEGLDMNALIFDKQWLEVEYVHVSLFYRQDKMLFQRVQTGGSTTTWSEWRIPE